MVGVETTILSVKFGDDGHIPKEATVADEEARHDAVEGKRIPLDVLDLLRS